MAHYEPSHLGLCCLQKPIIIACGSESVNLAIASGKAHFSPKRTNIFLISVHKHVVVLIRSALHFM